MPSVTVNNGITLEYESFGNVGDPAILLVMGLGAQLLLWPDALVEMLVAKGFRVVRFDNRDVGLSTKLDHLGSPSMPLTFMKFMLRIPLRAAYKVGDMARDTAGLVEALSLGRTHVVGASMGGMIGQNLASAFPDMVASLTSIMSTTGNRRLPQPTWRARSALLSRPAKVGDVEAGTRHLMHLLRVIGSRTHPAEEGYLRNFCERHVRRSFYPPGVARQLLAIAASDDRSATIARITAPTLVMHGIEDPLLPPACGVETARVIREAGGFVTLEIVEGMGHDLPVPLLPRIADSIAAHCKRSAAEAR
jgi:proline iminopeptidase